MYDQCLHPAVLSLLLWFYMMRIDILCTSCCHGYVLNFHVPSLLQKSCNLVELNGRNLSKLWAFVQWGHDRAMLDARFFCGSEAFCFFCYVQETKYRKDPPKQHRLTGWHSSPFLKSNCWVVIIVLIWRYCWTKHEQVQSHTNFLQPLMLMSV